MNLKYQEFVEAVKEKVKGKAGEETTIKMNSVLKNNSVYLDGLSIMEKGSNISPTIYLNDYYEDYKEGKELNEIADTILEVHNHNKVTLDFDIDFFTEFDLIKDRIVYKLISYEKNLTLLEQVPHMVFLDLAIVFYCLVSHDSIGNMTILVYNNHKKLWNITTETLFHIAAENTPRMLNCQIQNMEEVIMEMLEDGQYDQELQEKDSMYIISNVKKLNGAICILYQDVLKNLSEQLNSDLYILPSSVHETIVVPVSESYPREKLEEMVQEVNETQVAREDILSGKVYIYQRDMDRISM